MRQRAFTLTELLVVIAVVAILVSVLLPVFVRLREKSRQNACMGHLKELSQAIAAYAHDYDDVNVLSYQCRTSPIPWLYAHLLLPHSRSTLVSACPSQVVPLRAGLPGTDSASRDAPILEVSYTINANNDDAVDPSTCQLTLSSRRPGFAGVSRLRIIRPEARLVLMDSETNPSRSDQPNPSDSLPVAPPNRWRIYDPNPPLGNPNASIGVWLTGRHSDGTNALFADGHGKWFAVRQVANQCIREQWVADVP